MTTLHSPHKSHPTRRLKFGNRVIITHGLARLVFQDLYHYFMTVSWTQLFLTFAAFFLGVDTLFGLAYALVPGCIAHLNPPGLPGAFFFSVETLATVGYGEMHPQTLYGHIVSMVELFVGLMSIALITGIMFARFSVPRARFLFAQYGVVRHIDGKLTLMFRAANERQNIVQEASAQLRMLRDDVTPEGFRLRRITDLALVRAQHPLFALGWNIMHVLDETSPLYGEAPESVHESRAIFILSLSGTDETTGQVLMARHEYAGSAIHWNSTFRDIMEIAPDGTVHFDYRKFHDIEPLSEPANRGELR
jgi:inward rectifier potassium channel